MKLWLTESQFIEIEDKPSLMREIAPRSRSIDWMGVMGFLPDPDPVLRKLGQDVTVYRQLLTDAHVWSCYQSRKSGVLSCEWEIREPEALSRSSRRLLRMVEESLSEIDLFQVMCDMLDAVFYGMSPIEILWQSSPAGWWPGNLVGKPPEWFGFDEQNRLRFRSKENMIEGEFIPPYKFLLPTHHATYQNPYGERTLSRCFWPVAFKKGGFKFWAIFTEKYGMPWLVGKVPRSTNSTERDQLLSKLAQMVQDAVAVINDDESIDIIESASKSASAEIYEKLISAANREISKAILGQTLSTEIDKGGSYAAAKEHMEVRADLVDQDKHMVATAMNQLFRWVGELNAPDAAPPLFGFYEEDDVQKDRAERDEILTRQGVRFKQAYYEKAYALDPDDFDVQAPGRPVLGAAGADPASLHLHEEEQTPAFAETQSATKFQGEVELLADESARAAQAELDRLIEPVMALVEKAVSLEEIGEGLYELYPQMESQRFQELLARAMSAAAMTGYVAASEERS